MRKEIISFLAVLLGAIFYNVAFWDNEMGLNSLIFAIIILSLSYFFHKEAFAYSAVKISAMGVLLSAKMVFWVHSDFSQVIHILTLMAHIGLVNAPQIRFLGTSFALFFAQFFSIPIKFIQNIFEIPSHFGKGKVFSQFKTLALSVIVVPIFFFIYYQTNSDLKAFSDQFGLFLAKIFSFDITFGRFMFFCFAILIVGSFIYQVKSKYFEHFEAQFALQLIEKNKTEESAINIKEQYGSALVLLIMLNVLILLNNLLDIKNVWLKMGELSKSSDLKEFVHSGTYILILGILLAMGVIFYLFRAELNFISNKNLEKLAYLWLIQNLFCVFSVAVRNIQYINQCGLAYKRIGVFIFLTLVCIGLGLMYHKVKAKRTAFYVIQRGSWAIYGVLLLCTLINWDTFITKFNINHASSQSYFDAHFLTEEVSDKNLPYLYQHQEQLKVILKNQKDPIPTYYGYYDFDKELKEKIGHFKQRTAKQTFWSWNHADYQTYNYLKKVGEM